MHAWPVERDQRKTRQKVKWKEWKAVWEGEGTRGLMPATPKPPRETIGWDRIGLGVRHLGTRLDRAGLARWVGRIWAGEGTRADWEALSKQTQEFFFFLSHRLEWLPTRYL